MRPKLRSLSIRHHTQDGHPYLLLRDPQQITDHTLLIPQPLATVLAFCDGEHEIKALPGAFQRYAGFRLPFKWVEELVHALDEALMLENARFFAAYERTLAAYRQASHRPAALAGLSYPAQRHQLWQLLQDYLEAIDPLEPLPIDWSRPVGLLSPHIDYPRGGAVYAQVWKRATRIAQEAELAILLGTDHYGGDRFTLTRQNYATPYGLLPTDQAIVNQLAQAIGVEAAFAGELRHRGEHSLELVAVWLHHLRAGQPCAIVPILCGGFHHYMKNGATPAQDPVINKVIATLQRAAKGRRTVVIASGDLAHVGPAFGGAPLTVHDRAQVNAADEQLLHHMRNGDDEGFFSAIRQVQDANNVCGLAPIYLTMRTLATHHAPLRGHPTGYATCPADEYGTSVVTVGGMIFH
ncbi:MAG: AmmeMemoRadiSam system protein B [Caldilinea sp. CFX5]|nr:AmmeMemoRadiSam system protein B [Caldilinea sp. CFX5]